VIKISAPWHTPYRGDLHNHMVNVHNRMVALRVDAPADLVLLPAPAGISPPPLHARTLVPS
jgi:hypothetical protein